MRGLPILIGATVLIIAAAIAVVILPGKTVAPTGEAPGETPMSSAEIPGLITVSAPAQGARVSSPLVVQGRARGPWYFEASFPIELRDAQGATIAQGYAEAQGEWMTEEFVAFKSVPLAFPQQPAGSMGTLVLHKANASGLPEHDRSLSVPVAF